MEIQSIMRGHHIYKVLWTPVIGEELTVTPEENNNHNRHTIAVMKGGEVVGHVPRELSRILYFFLRRSGSCVLCVITGRRKYGVGLEVPCVYKINGQSKCIEKLKRLLNTAVETDANTVLVPL